MKANKSLISSLRIPAKIIMKDKLFKKAEETLKIRGWEKIESNKYVFLKFNNQELVLLNRSKITDLITIYFIINKNNITTPIVISSENWEIFIPLLRTFEELLIYKTEPKLENNE